MFDQNGHLTQRAVAALVRNEDLDERTRLEIAEHLAYCDLCLQRYTQALTEDALLSPAESCRDTIWRRIRQRTVRILTSRYATAAAAVALALTLVFFLGYISVLHLMEEEEFLPGQNYSSIETLPD